jgi:predicted phage tail protein
MRSRQVTLERIDYAPSWAKIEAVFYEGDREMARVAGEGGNLPLEVEITDMEPEVIAIENLSIDAEVRANLRFRSWQAGEG